MTPFKKLFHTKNYGIGKVIIFYHKQAIRKIAPAHLLGCEGLWVRGRDEIDGIKPASSIGWLIGITILILTRDISKGLSLIGTKALVMVFISAYY